MTAKQFKAHKGLEAYNQFVCGWVKEIKTRKVAGKYVTTGRVSSQATFQITNFKVFIQHYFVFGQLLHVYFCIILCCFDVYVRHSQRLSETPLKYWVIIGYY